MQAVVGEMYAAQSRRLVRACERVAYGQAALTLKGKGINMTSVANGLLVSSANRFRQVVSSANRFFGG